MERTADVVIRTAEVNDKPNHYLIPGGEEVRSSIDNAEKRLHPELLLSELAVKASSAIVRLSGVEGCYPGRSSCRLVQLDSAHETITIHSLRSGDLPDR